MNKFDLSVLDNINTKTPQIVSSGDGSKISKVTNLVKAVNPEMIVLDLIAIIPQMIETWGEVSIKKEETKQIKYKSQAFIIAQKEDTKQLAISEREATKRYDKEIKAKIQENNNQTKLELKKIENLFVTTNNAHEAKMHIIRIIDCLIAEKSVYRANYHQKIMKEPLDAPSRTKLLEECDKLMKKMDFDIKLLYDKLSLIN